MGQRSSSLVVTRRQAIGVGVAGIASALAACASSPTSNREVPGNPRLAARPGQPAFNITPGLHELGLGTARDGLLYVPTGYDAATPAPFALMLHGATGSANQGLIPFHFLADEMGLILLAPDSRFRTWDMLLGGYDVDVQFIDMALAAVFQQCAIDPARVAIAGFSDGASYALSLGTSNGALFRHIAAFSPGFLVMKSPQEKPRILVSHGTQDQVLPIEKCSRRIVPQLRGLAYTVDYREFDGRHEILTSMARAAAEQVVNGVAAAAAR